MIQMLIKIMLDSTPEQMQLNNQYLAIRVLIQICNLNFNDLSPEDMRKYEEVYPVDVSEVNGMNLLNKYDIPKQIINSKKMQTLRENYPTNRAILQPYELSQRTNLHLFWCWTLAFLKDYVLNNINTDPNKFKDAIQFL
jgi:hypothetical protein